MGDNFYTNCPARSYGRDLSNFNSSSMNNEYIKFMNGITRDDDYRLFLQMNGNALRDSEWMYLRKNYSCFNNACVHTFPLRQNPKDFYEERERANLLFKKNKLPTDLKCEKYPDYRMSRTPLNEMNVEYNCSTCK
jgi:hypothetical protein